MRGGNGAPQFPFFQEPNFSTTLPSLDHRIAREPYYANMTHATDLNMTLETTSPNLYSSCMYLTCAKKYAHVIAGVTAIILMLIAVLKFIYISSH